MPYKDPIKRKEQWRKWAVEHKDDKSRKEKQRVRAMTRYVLKEKKNCSVEGCEVKGERHHLDYSKPLEIIWLCNKHHDFIHRPKIRVCSVLNCKRTHRARNLCNTHYMQKLRKKALDQVLSAIPKHY